MDQERNARVREALYSMNKHHKKEIAIEGLKEARKKVDHGIVTLCMVYNATGETLKYLYNHSFFGSFVEAMTSVDIPNGEWHCFLHKGGFYIGSGGAVVHRAQKKPGEFSDVMQAWETPWNQKYKNRVYTEIRGFQHFMLSNNRWGTVQDKTEARKVHVYEFYDDDGAFKSIVKTHEHGHNPIFEGIITLKDAFVPPH